MLKKSSRSFDPVGYLIWLGQLNRLHRSTDHKLVGSMDPVEPFEPVGSFDSDGIFDAVGSIDPVGQFKLVGTFDLVVLLNAI